MMVRTMAMMMVTMVVAVVMMMIAKVHRVFPMCWPLF